jgi:hypothetical protein
MQGACRVAAPGFSRTQALSLGSHDRKVNWKGGRLEGGWLGDWKEVEGVGKIGKEFGREIGRRLEGVGRMVGWLVGWLWLLFFFVHKIELAYFKKEKQSLSSYSIIHRS